MRNWILNYASLEFQVLCNLLLLNFSIILGFCNYLHCVTVAPTASGFSRNLFLFLLLEEELDVHATHGFLQTVEHLELRIHSLVPPFFHLLPIIHRIDSEYFEILASS